MIPHYDEYLKEITAIFAKYDLVELIAIGAPSFNEYETEAKDFLSYHGLFTSSADVKAVIGFVFDEWFTGGKSFNFDDLTETPVTYLPTYGTYIPSDAMVAEVVSIIQKYGGFTTKEELQSRRMDLPNDK